MNSRLFSSALFFLFLAGVTPGRSGTVVSDKEVAEPLTPSAPGRPAGWLAVAPGFTHQFEADVDSSDTTFSVDRWRVEAGTRVPLADGFVVTAAVEAEWSQYDFTQFTSVADGMELPESDLFRAGVTAFGMYEWNDSWEVVAGGSLSWGGASDADFGDGFGGMGILGVTYRFSPVFSLTPAVLALSRMEDDALIIPVLGVEWEMSDAWKLRSIGPGAELTWQAADQWGFFLRGLYRPRDFRLAAEGELASSVLRDRSFPVSVGVEWKPTARVTATAFGGAILGGSLQFKEDGGEDIFEEDYDVTPMVGGSLMILF
jgi:hypothetical protein